MILYTLPAIAQHFPMLHYGMEDGLPSNTVYEIYRDSKGFLWIGTDKGVARFNGTRFEKFTTFDGLADNEVFFFQEDYQGRIWLATYNGELCFYKDGIFHNAQNTPALKLPFKSSNYVCFIGVERDSTMIISFYGNPNILNIRNNTITVRNLQNPYNDSIIRMTQVNDWLGKEAPLYRTIFTRKINDSVLEVNYPKMRLLVDENNRITDVKFLADYKLKPRFCTFTQNVRLYCDDSIIYYTSGEVLSKTPSFLNAAATFVKSGTNIKLKSNSIIRIYVKGNSKIYVADNGLYSDSSLILSKNNISSLTQDTIGNYWLSTLNEGIFRISEDFYNKKFVEKGYSGVVKYSCVRNGRLIYVTDTNEVYFLDGYKPVCLLSDPAMKQPTTYPAACLIDSNYKFYCFYRDTHFTIENLFSAKKQKITYKIGTEKAIRTLFLAKEALYFNDADYVLKIDYLQLRPNVKIDPFIKLCHDRVMQERIFSSAQYTDGSIWYATRHNIYKVINDKGERQQQFKDVSFKTFDFCGKYIVGCSHGNLLEIGNNFEQSPIFDTVKGENCVWNKLYNIDSNHVLVSTNSNYRLLTLFWSDSKPKFEVFSIENPIIPLQAESICSDGKNCYFFKKGSITSIDVKTLFKRSLPPAVFFAYLKTGQKKLSIKDEFSIPFESSKRVVLGFSTISFGGKDVNYQYSVSKNDADNWGSIEGEEINLINPGYGNYTIKVRAKTLSSDYSAPVVFKLHITKPYWATWWFISLIAIITGSVIALLVRGRVLAVIAKRERAHDDKVKFMKSEYKALNALMNPHFIFNTLNNVQSLVNGNDKLAANEYLRVFADLVRQNMHNVSKELIPLQKEVDLVTNYLSLEKLRFEDKLNYKINLDDGLDLFDIMIPPLLIQPLVENSIKHGILPLKSGNGFIEINIRDQNDVLIIEIKDNGVGLNNSKQKSGSLHESFGLDNIRKRIEQLSIIQDKEITFRMEQVTDDQGTKWTAVTVTMQL